jgi:hypothetical protein
MKSWSYQSTNPCTVLVKEKQDGHSSTGCPPHLLQSSTESAALPHDQPDSSSLGNIVGGKKLRKKRQAHEEDDGISGVVFDVNGKESKSMHELLEKRILVNISIAMDKGMGTVHQEVYKLQVAVPLPKETMAEKQFYSYDIGDVSEGFIKIDPQLLTESNEAESVSTYTETSDESSVTMTEDYFTVTSIDGEGLRN